MKLEELFNSLKVQSENRPTAIFGQNGPPQGLPLQPAPQPQPQMQNLNQNFLGNDEYLLSNQNHPRNMLDPPPGLFSGLPQTNVPPGDATSTGPPAMLLGNQSPAVLPPSFVSASQPFPLPPPLNGHHFVPFPAPIVRPPPFGPFSEPHPNFMAPQFNPQPLPMPVPFQMVSPFPPQFSALPLPQQFQQQQQQQMQFQQQQMAYKQGLEFFNNNMIKSTEDQSSLLVPTSNKPVPMPAQVPVEEGESMNNLKMLFQRSTVQKEKTDPIPEQNAMKKEDLIDKTAVLPVNNVSKKSIRVNVNDLFSLSKVYSENNNSIDANKMLFDILQKQEVENQVKSANLFQKINDISDKMSSTVSNDIYQELTNLNENYCSEILKQLRKELQTTSDSIDDIMSEHEDLRERNYIFTMIIQYFQHISQRLQTQNVTYLNLIDSFQYNYDDFAVYGPRFRDFIQNSKMFSSTSIKEYLSLLKNYEQFYPIEIMRLRKVLLKMKLTYSKRLEKVRLAQTKIEIDKLLKEKTPANEQQTQSGNENNMLSSTSPIPVSYDMITFQKIDSRNLHSSISALRTTKEQIKHFLEKTSLSPEGEQNRIDFLDCLDRALKNSEFVHFCPTLHKFGSLSNGMGTYDSDIDIVIKFENLKIDVLDYGTLMLALEVIECILQEQLGIQSKDNIVPSKRCPIIKLNFSSCFPQIRKRPETDFNKCDISLISSYGVYNSKLLHFLTKYDYRFRELTLILKYWAKRNELIDTTTFSSYGFTMLIIFFLQNTNPPVLPTVSRLQDLAKQQKGNEALMVNKFNFQFCNDITIVGKSKNTQSVPELLLDFFRFYVKFDFYNNAVSPRLGTAVKKINMRKEKLENNFDNFNMASYVCIEDPFVLEHNVGFIFRARNVQRFNTLLRSMIYKLTPNNCLKVLVDPKNFMNCKYSNSSCVFIPFNLFCYEVIITEHFLSYPIQPKSIFLLPTAHQVPLEQSFESMQKLFFIIVRHLLVNYFALANVEEALQLQFNADRSILCSVDFAYLNHISSKLDIRKNHKYDSLFQSGRKRSADALKRFSLLKMLRDDIRRLGMTSLGEAEKKQVVPGSGKVATAENWFKLELPSHPPVHQLQLSPASHQALLDANQQTILPYFNFRMLVPSTSKHFNLAARYGELLQEILQKFCFSIDRVNAVATFASQVEEFFEG